MPTGFDQMLTSKNRRVSFSSELLYTRFQLAHDNKKHQSRIALFDQLKIGAKKTCVASLRFDQTACIPLNFLY